MPNDYPTSNIKVQDYRGIKLRLDPAANDGSPRAAKRFVLIKGDGTSSGVHIWIPNSVLLEDGTLNPGLNHDWIFNKPENRQKLSKIGFEFRN